MTDNYSNEDGSGLLEEDGKYFHVKANGERTPLPKEVYDVWNSYLGRD